MITLTEPITFITGNVGKVQWTERYAQIPFTHQKLDLPEIQSLDVYEIAEYKVREAFKEIQKPLLVEDTALVFDAFGNLPGPFIKWFLDEIGNEKLCTMLTDNRAATATVVYAFFDGKKVLFFDNTMQGSIAHKPRGETGFGWDFIFIPEGYEKTHAEMTLEERDTLSYRKKALQKMNTMITYAK